MARAFQAGKQMKTNTHSHTLSAVRAMIILAAVTLLLGGCGSGSGGGSDSSGQGGQSMDAIYQSDGIPVQTRSVEPETFVIAVAQNASLEASRESSVVASLSGEVASIEATVGEKLAKGQVVLRFPTDTPSLQYQEAKASLDNAKWNYTRLSNLYDAGNISEQKYQSAKTGYETARASFEKLQEIIAPTSPIDGTLVKLDVQESEHVNPGEALFTVADPGNLEARVWLTDTEIGSVAVGDAVTANWNNQEIHGTVIQKDLTIDQRRGAYGVRVRFPNPDQSVPLGVTAEVRVPVYRQRGAVVLNRAEVVEQNGTPYAFVVQDKKAVRRKLQIGRSTITQVEIASGINAGDQVITEGQTLVSDGSLVKLSGSGSLSENAGTSQ